MTTTNNSIEQLKCKICKRPEISEDGYKHLENTLVNGICFMCSMLSIIKK